MKHTPALPYAIGTRYSNSEWYDEATSEVVHGWQVFEQHSPDGKLTGRKSFVDHLGNLCGIDIAEYMRERALVKATPELLAALQVMVKAFAVYAPKTDGAEYKCINDANAAIAKAQGVSINE